MDIEINVQRKPQLTLRRHKLIKEQKKNKKNVQNVESSMAGAI